MYKEILRREPQHNGLRCLIWKCVSALVSESMGDRQPLLALILCEFLSCYKAGTFRKQTWSYLQCLVTLKSQFNFRSQDPALAACAVNGSDRLVGP